MPSFPLETYNLIKDQISRISLTKWDNVCGSAIQRKTMDTKENTFFHVII